MAKQRIKKSLPYLFILMMTVLILLPQIHSHFFISGIDYYFHMSRTYETAMQIKTGHLSYFLSIFSWQQNARIIDAMYGPLGSYFSGLLLLITGSWFRWELSLYVILLLVAGVGMHRLNQYWHVKPLVDLATTALYMLSPVVFAFILWQLFYGFGAALIPWVFLAGSRIVDHRFSIVKLTVLMVIIAELHLLTLMLSIIILACFTLATLICRGHRIKLLYRLGIATAATIILTFNVWGALLEVSMSNPHHLLLTYPNPGEIDGGSFNTIMNTYPHTSIWQTPSIIGPFIFLITIGTFIVWLVKCRRYSLAFNITALLGIFFIWISSNWFPWGTIQREAPVVNTVIQFPARFLSVGLVGIYLVLGKMLSNSKKVIWISVFALLLLTICNTGINNYRSLSSSGQLFYSHQVIRWRNMKPDHHITPNSLRNSLRSPHPDRFINAVGKPLSDYLPTSAYYTDKTPNVFINLHPYAYAREQLLFPHYHNFSYQVSLRHRAEELVNINSFKRQRTLLPFVKYQHTVMRLNGRLIHPRISRVGAISVALKNGHNQLRIYYEPSRIYKVGIIISIFAWLLFMGLVVVKFLKKINN